MNEEKLTLREAAEKYRIGYAAVYMAILNERIKGFKVGKRWHVYDKDMLDYQATKYSRDFTKINGDLVYDPQKKEMSVKQCAKLFGVNPSVVYNRIKRQKLICVKKGGALVLRYEDCLSVFGENPKQIRFA